jgi:hypothetical protein
MQVKFGLIGCRSPGSIHSLIALVNDFFQKYFPASAQHAAVQKIFDFE